MITIVDYGLGNLGSIRNMFNKIGCEVAVSSEKSAIQQASKIILPGVGAFDKAMGSINESGLKEVLEQKALEERVPFLGICLGMQLLTNSSDEGKLSGFGWIPAVTKTFSFENGTNLKVPHMGWNDVYKSTPSQLTEDLPEDPRFYFVHSYYVKVEDCQHSILQAVHGLEFDCGIQKDNIMGVQFHPEKSHKYGMKLLKNFMEL